VSRFTLLLAHQVGALLPEPATRSPKAAEGVGHSAAKRCDEGARAGQSNYEYVLSARFWDGTSRLRRQLVAAAEDIWTCDVGRIDAETCSDTRGASWICQMEKDGCGRGMKKTARKQKKNAERVVPGPRKARLTRALGWGGCCHPQPLLATFARSFCQTTLAFSAAASSSESTCACSPLCVRRVLPHPVFSPIGQ
jgi:hypothetical protein